MKCDSFNNIHKKSTTSSDRNTVLAEYLNIYYFIRYNHSMLIKGIQYVPTLKLQVLDFYAIRNSECSLIHLSNEFYYTAVYPNIEVSFIGVPSAAMAV